MEHQSTCPRCQATFPITAESTITTFQCPKCGDSFHIKGDTAVNESDVVMFEKPNPLMDILKVFGLFFVMVVCATILAAVGFLVGQDIGLHLHPKTGHMDFGFRAEGICGFFIGGIAGLVLPVVVFVFRKNRSRR
jgi:predicted RNA-binding Zn-ribbon protein involved in translation (DUF1610 family)